MSRPAFTLTLSPADRRLEIPPGTRLQDVLFAQGVEFPCGGAGTLLRNHYAEEMRFPG